MTTILSLRYKLVNVRRDRPDRIWVTPQLQMLVQYDDPPREVWEDVPSINEDDL